MSKQDMNVDPEQYIVKTEDIVVGDFGARYFAQSGHRVSLLYPDYAQFDAAD
mgnify:CR=1 FL=1